MSSLILVPFCFYLKHSSPHTLINIMPHSPPSPRNLSRVPLSLQGARSSLHDRLRPLLLYFMITRYSPPLPSVTGFGSPSSNEENNGKVHLPLGILPTRRTPYLLPSYKPCLFPLLPLPSNGKSAAQLSWGRTNPHPPPDRFLIPLQCPRKYFFLHRGAEPNAQRMVVCFFSFVSAYSLPLRHPTVVIFKHPLVMPRCPPLTSLNTSFFVKLRFGS